MTNSDSSYWDAKADDLHADNLSILMTKILRWVRKSKPTKRS